MSQMWYDGEQAVGVLSSLLGLSLGYSAVLPIHFPTRNTLINALSSLVIPAKARDYVFTGVGLSVCLFVCYHDN